MQAHFLSGPTIFYIFSCVCLYFSFPDSWGIALYTNVWLPFYKGSGKLCGGGGHGSPDSGSIHFRHIEGFPKTLLGLIKAGYGRTPTDIKQNPMEIRAPKGSLESCLREGEITGGDSLQFFMETTIAALVGPQAESIWTLLWALNLGRECGSS